MIRSLLIANRGEIAVRIARTCRRLGIRTVAVYSDADRDALHVAVADEAVRIGPGPARDSYLRANAIIDAARRTRAEAVHPGYGFLSEKPELASLCVDAGLVFVGPSADRIAAMGSKIGAKEIAQRAGVPCVPGYAGADQSDARLADEAKRIGFPIMIKASAGGGGRGMRRVFADAETLPALDIARQEAQAAFGDPALLIEKLVLRPRHLEVQIAGDTQGNVVHLFERDCSVQRNNQKLLEEAPAPNLPPAVRTRLLDRAIALAKAIRYDNLGTIEFILDEGHDDPWFLEMNTRLQVEHPVTEAITGYDLVEWQIRIASGEQLPAKQDDIREQGHCIEARITAERADQDFQPDAGRIFGYREPRSIRVDSGVAKGSEVTLFYDSLLAKTIASGATRDEALARLAVGLRDYAIAGPANTLPFLIDAIDHPIFREGRATTRFIEDAFPAGWAAKRDNIDVARAVAAMLSPSIESGSRVPPSAWGEVAGFRLLASAGGHAEARFRVADDDETVLLSLVRLADGRYRARCEEREVTFAMRCDGDDVEIETNGRLVRATAYRRPGGVAVHMDGATISFAIEREAEASATTAGGSRSGIVAAPMPGIVAEIKVAVGDVVAQGHVVAVLESMKLFISLSSDVAGTIEDVACARGDTVRAGARLIVITPQS